MTSSNEIQLKPDERVDELNRKGYRIIQDTKQFCFGMDAVLLSAFVKVKPKQRVLDLGTGTGVIPILLEAKTPGEHFTGLEIQPDSADMAGRSVALNGLTDKIDIVTGDIKDASKIFGASSFDIISFSNCLFTILFTNFSIIYFSPHPINIYWINICSHYF